MRILMTISVLLLSLVTVAQRNPYPQGYFRHPLNIKMELVSNFGELRTNHWHMGLDIRTQQRENLPVYASADGYIAEISISAFGFGRAIYINHPNGLTTLYAHLNNFEPKLHQWVIDQQYKGESWETRLQLPPNLFPVKKGDLIAYSGNTGGSAGPHVHFEIRDTETTKCLNPLLFKFPIPDAVPPQLIRLAMYDRNKSTYAQSPQLMALKAAGGGRYTLAAGSTLRVGSDKISFALGAVDRFSGVANPNGIYSARIELDGVLQSEFVLDSIDYNETRYMNAHIDYRYKAAGGHWLQHLSRLPGDTTQVYKRTPTDGVVYVDDKEVHDVVITVQDAAFNTSRLSFKVQNTGAAKTYTTANEQLVPGEVSVFERDGFELYTTEYSVYDTVNITFKETPSAAAASPLYAFASHTFPIQDSVTVRIKVDNVAPEDEDKIIIRNVAGTRITVTKAHYNDGWATAKFRQLGTFQAFVDNQPPVINAPGTGSVIDLSRATRIVFTPTDNFKELKNFRAELDGQWLLFTNDKGRNFIYSFDKYFTPGTHTLTVSIEDEAGNKTTRSWQVRR
ncbi:MAG: peptidoglycan DD-metalloendopeptidase family protein [Chitinophagaceae bacterium]